MNRNYLPPSLVNAHQVSGSPPSNSYVISQQRRYGRTCKLPTVQEVMGKWANFFIESDKIWSKGMFKDITNNVHPFTANDVTRTAEVCN